MINLHVGDVGGWVFPVGRFGVVIYMIYSVFIVRIQ